MKRLRLAGLLGVFAVWASLTGCADDLFAPTVETRFVAVAAGAEHTCALDGDGRAWCWGSNSHGQLGVAKRHRGADAPVAVNGVTRFRAIAAGGEHTCAIAPDDRPWCWGGNGSGQIGDGTFEDRTAPRPVLLAPKASVISAGASQSCAVDDRGTPWCWGANDRGQLGSGAGTAANVPTRIEGIPLVSMVTVGGGHACAGGPGGTFCWGANDAFQLGAATVRSSSLPVRVSTQSILHRVVAGRSHSCALTDRQTLLCWGDNSGGQLGVTDLEAAGTPVAPWPGGPRVLLSASASGGLTCAASPMDVVCWGTLSDPELGDVRTLPTPVVGIEVAQLESIALGSAHGCAVADGKVWCWGKGGSGQLGDGWRRASEDAVEVARASP